MLASHNAEELRIEFSIEINAPPAKVWDKLATIEGMNQWFARDLVFEHKVGGRFEMKGEMPGDGPFRFTGQVVTVEPERELTFTWRDSLSENAWPADTLVSFKLEPSTGGTKVTLIHSGFEALGSGLAKPSYNGHIQGWQMSETLVDLKKAAEA